MKDLIQADWWEQSSQNQDAIILDVRTPEEVSEGKIPKAVNVNISDPHSFLEKLQSFDKSASYFVYCRSGARSTQACAVMRQMGFENSFNLIGGILEWNGPIE